MRPVCSDCAKKHISQAQILLSESKRGYPTHRLLALGHLAEAEEELIAKYPNQVEKIRERRKKLEDNPTYENGLMDLLEMVDKECDECALDHEHGHTCRAGETYNHETGRCE